MEQHTSKEAAFTSPYGSADIDTVLTRSLSEPEVLVSPNEYYRALRQRDPVHYDENAGLYFVSRYEDLQTVVHDPITFSVGRAWMKTFATGHFEEFKQILIRDGGGYFPDAIMTDPPTHTRVRRLLQAAFTPHRINHLKPAIQRLTADLITRLAERGECDGVADFANPLTIGIMCEQLGLNHDDADDIVMWARVFTTIRGNQSAEQMREDAKHFCDLQNYIIARIREREEQRREDMISDLIYAREDGEENPTLTFEEVVSLTRAMVIGGIETIGTALANLMFMLATNPAVVRALAEAAEDDAKLSRFVDEVLRIEPPGRGLFRVTTRDVELGGTLVPENSMLCLLFGSANDDESLFDHPREFDMNRKNLKRNMTFGGGIHFCVGMHLARMEMKVAAQEIARQLKDIRLRVPPTEIPYVPTLSVLSMARLPLSFAPR